MTTTTPSVTWREKWLVLNCYGTLLIAVAIALARIVFLVGAHLATAPLAIALAPALGAATWGLRITARLPTKLRVFRTTLKRIERKGYSPRYFETLCGEPCMRQVTWLALKRSGHVHEYRALVSRYRSNGTFHLEHSNPAIEDLILNGELPEQQIRDAVQAMLQHAKMAQR